MKALLKVVAFLVALILIVGNDYSNLPTTVFVVGVSGAVITSFLPAQFLHTGRLCAGIDIEIWKQYIIEKLRKDNAFIFKSRDDSGFVLGGSVVHIPQAGADPVVVKNRNSYPGVAVRRTDTDVTYVLDSYSTDPTHIPWADLQTISYAKLDSVLGQHMLTLGEVIADDLLIKWSPVAAQFVRTTGGPTAGTQAGIGGQTGTRKGFHHKDLQKAMVTMNVTNTPKAGRVAMIDDNMYEFFYDTLSDSQMNAFQQYANNQDGVVGRLHGFDIMTRSSVLAYATNDTVKALGASLGTTDNLASLCWHPSTICRALGETKPFQDKDNPLYFGDIYSMIVRMGGRKERADNLGVVGIVQAP